MKLPKRTPFVCLVCMKRHYPFKPGERLYVNDDCMERYTVTRSGRVWYVEVWTSKYVRWYPQRKRRTSRGK